MLSKITQMFENILPFKNRNNRLDVTSKNFISLLHFLRDHTMTQCKQLVEIAAVDMPKNLDYRFSVNYILYSMRFSTRVVINTQISETGPLATSLTLFQSANWLEREVWDMFGIFFTGHSDLRRILTDYNFQGHPLRKDFPLSGFTSLMFSDIRGRIIHTPLKLQQEKRIFNLQQREMSFKTNPKANRYGISMGTLMNVPNNFRAYGSKFRSFLLAYLSMQSLLTSKKITMLKLWYLKNSVVTAPVTTLTGRLTPRFLRLPKVKSMTIAKGARVTLIKQWRKRNPFKFGNTKVNYQQISRTIANYRRKKYGN